MEDDKNLSRRAFVRLCVGTGAAVTTNPRLLADTPAPLRPTESVALVTQSGTPIRAGDLSPGETYVFNYPYVSTPCFLIELGRPTETVSGLETEDGRRYSWKGGVGPQRSVVAFSAICAHRMSYPTKDISFISYRHEEVRFTDLDRNAVRKEQVIYCCSEGSVYDPAEGGRVLGGPAPQPLAAVDLTCSEDGAISACGTYGGDMFDRFFEGFGFQLSLIHGTEKFREPASDTSVVVPLEEYTRNQRTC
jgi:arsenite oxidase small subunit